MNRVEDEVRAVRGMPWARLVSWVNEAGRKLRDRTLGRSVSRTRRDQSKSDR